jgi:hypothetical protein
MKRLVLIGLFAAMSATMASADVVTLSENNSDGTPVISLSAILNQWGTPSDTTSAFTIGGAGTDGVAGLTIVNDLSPSTTITSLQVYVYGTYSDTNDSTLKYQCGVNNFFDTCTPQLSSATTLPDPSTILQSSPIEFDYFCTGTCTGITSGTKFHLIDSVDGTLGSGTKLFYEIEINGNPPTTATPEPATVIPAGAAFLAMGLLAFRRRKTSADSSF